MWEGYLDYVSSAVVQNGLYWVEVVEGVLQFGGAYCIYTLRGDTYGVSPSLHNARILT